MANGSQHSMHQPSIQHTGTIISTHHSWEHIDGQPGQMPWEIHRRAESRQEDAAKGNAQTQETASTRRSHHGPTSCQTQHELRCAITSLGSQLQHDVATSNTAVSAFSAKSCYSAYTTLVVSKCSQRLSHCRLRIAITSTTIVRPYMRSILHTCSGPTTQSRTAKMIAILLDCRCWMNGMHRRPPDTMLTAARQRCYRAQALV